GWKKEEVLGKPTPLIPAGLELEHQQVRDRAAAGETILGFETKRLRRDGTLLDVSLFCAPIHDSHQAVRGTIVLMMDTTESHRVEGELLTLLDQSRRDSERFRALHSLAVAASGHLDPGQLGQDAVEFVCQLVGADSSSIYSCDADS